MSRYKASYQNEKSSIRLRIWGYEDGVNNLDALLGVKHEVALESGDRYNGRAPAKTSYWAYVLPDTLDSCPEDMVLRLLSIFKNKQHILRDISKKCKVTVSITQTVYIYNPEYEFTPQLLEQVTSIGATLWLDIYSFRETYLEEEEQKGAMCKTLKDSRSANRLGILDSNERKLLVDILAGCEKLQNELNEELFPDYADGEPTTDDDIRNGLLKMRAILLNLHDQIERSSFLMFPREAKAKK